MKKKSHNFSIFFLPPPFSSGMFSTVSYVWRVLVGREHWVSLCMFVLCIDLREFTPSEITKMAFSKLSIFMILCPFCLCTHM